MLPHCSDELRSSHGQLVHGLFLIFLSRELFHPSLLTIPFSNITFHNIFLSYTSLHLALCLLPPYRSYWFVILPHFHSPSGILWVSRPFSGTNLINHFMDLKQPCNTRSLHRRLDTSVASILQHNSLFFSRPPSILLNFYVAILLFRRNACLHSFLLCRLLGSLILFAPYTFISQRQL